MNSAATSLPSVDAVLRGAFPLWFAARSGEYVAAFVDVLLTDSGVAPLVDTTPFDRAVSIAQQTARGLAGWFVGGERGRA